MELYSAEAENLKKLLGEWLALPDQELEATFGPKGTVDITTFLSVAKRLRARGYRALPQEDRMTITLPEHIRFSVKGLGVIQAYCQDDILAGKPFITVIKDRTLKEANVDLDDYETRIKSRREIGMANDDGRVREVFSTWKQQKKAFRIIRRWSFEGEGLVIDMSIVRSTSKDMNGNYKWQRSFKEQDVMAFIPSYEIEVEMIRMEGDTPESALKRLVKGVGEVLRGIQKHTFLLRKSVSERVKNSYYDLVGGKQFRGVAPVTLELKNFTPLAAAEEGVPNVRTGYNVTDKADGLRVHAYCDSKGELFMMDMSLNVYKTGLVNQACRSSLLDGEWITKTKDNTAVQQLLLFDIYINSDKKKVSDLPFYVKDQKETRFELMKAWISRWNDKTVVGPGITATTKLQVVMKNFFFADRSDSEIFLRASQALDIKGIYNTDGLIFTPNMTPLPGKAGTGFLEQFKWKPAHDNTIDFLVSFEKFTDSREEKFTVGVKPSTGETVTYKTLRLFVGSSTDAGYQNPRETVLEAKPLSRGPKGQGYRPVVFNPKEFPDTMASVCHLQMATDPDTGEDYVMTDNSMEPIQDKNIVEMAYDPSEAPGWRWKPLRVRMDKTERLQRGILGRTLNSEMVAESVWNSIHDPITKSMIRTGASQPTEAELEGLSKEKEDREAISRRYWARTAPEADLRQVKGLRDFHNKWIKERILYATGLRGGGKTILDLAVGKAADLQRWRRMNVSFALGCDNAGENITDPENGAYRRYLNTLAGARGQPVAPMIFAIGDSSKRLLDGTAGVNEQEKDILRSVLGRIRPTGPVPAFVEKEGAGKLKMGADCITMMFALHYMFKNKQMFDGFLQNVADCLKVGGYFIGCCFDGKKVFDLLKGTPKDGRKSGLHKDALLWSITKKYDEDELPMDDSAFGLSVGVEFISIGTEHDEYLVPFPLLKAKMESIGCELLSEAELKEVGLQESTNTFDVSYGMTGKSFPMSDAVKQFSFLNRWFIFKRKAEKLPDEVVDSVPGSAAAPLENTKTVKKSKIRVVSALKGQAPSAEVPAPVSASAPAGPAGPVSVALTGAPANQVSVAPEKEAPGMQALATPGMQAPAPLRTVPVAPIQKGKTTYAPGEVFQFYAKAALQDKLKIKEPGAGRWLAPSTHFPLKDSDGVTYPSLEHYVAGMMYKLATNKPAVSLSVFSRDGEIHQEYVGQRLTETAGGTKPLVAERDYDLMDQEAKDVKAAVRTAAMKRYGATLDEVKWATVKDEVLRDALKQRWEQDAKLRKIIEAVRNQGKILLFYTPGAAANMGGIRRDDGSIEGDNKIGRIWMELANFPGF